MEPFLGPGVQGVFEANVGSMGNIYIHMFLLVSSLKAAWSRARDCLWVLAVMITKCVVLKVLDTSKKLSVKAWHIDFPINFWVSYTSSFTKKFSWPLWMEKHAADTLGPMQQRDLLSAVFRDPVWCGHRYTTDCTRWYTKDFWKSACKKQASLAVLRTNNARLFFRTSNCF